MIDRLVVKNSVAFDDVDLEFQKGFNVFSGASGSGKSVLMESLLAIFGLKESNAEVIEASLDMSDFQIDWDEFGLNQEDESLVLSIVKKEKTRYFLNRYGSSKKRLSEFTAGFAKHISSKGALELRAENILRVFDDFVSQKIPAHKEILAKLEMQFGLLQAAKSDLEILEEKEKNIQNLKEFATFEIEKISSIDPKEGEYEELLALKKSLSKKEKITQSIQEAMEVIDKLPKISHALAMLEKDCVLFEQGIQEALSILEEENARLEALEDLDSEKMLDRISLLSELIRRYGSIKDSLLHLEDQKQKLQEYEELSFNKEKLLEQIGSLKKICLNLAKQIREHRVKFIQEFEDKITLFCKQLLLKAPKISLLNSSLTKSGEEMINLELENTKIDSLSSGEYNRLRLVLMCLDAQINHSKGILVLDEIDANLSGQESEGVAKVLKMLSKTYQIFAISHQPHMPALADWHYLVSKENTKAQVRLLDKEGRVLEMARMISGTNITKEALEFAKKKLEESN